MDKERVFDKKMSQGIKGIAVLMMLMHHSFLHSSWFIGYSVSTFPFSEYSIIKLAELCKICVSFFAFITGYGLYLNYCDNKESAQKWVAKRYVSTFSGFWFAWIMSFAVLEIKYQRFSKILIGENNIFTGIVNGIVNILGLSNLFITPTPDTRWWYMSAAILFIFLTPMMYRFRNELGMVLLGELLLLRVIFVQQDNSVLLGMRAVYAFVTPYIFGCIFARYDIFDKWCTLGNGKVAIKIYKFIAELWVILFLCKMYTNTSKELLWELNYGIFPVIIILFLTEFVLQVSVIKKCMKYIGIHSANIYYIHSFVIYYHPEVLYKMHFVVTITIWLCLSLATSILIELAKRITRYNSLIKWVLTNEIKQPT